MEKDQPSSVDCWDLRQQKRDNRKAKEEMAKVDADRRREEEGNMSMEKVSIWMNDNNNADAEEDYNDENFELKEVDKKRRKLNVMGKMALAADRIGLSCRDRTTIAAAVVNAVGINVHDTDIKCSRHGLHGKNIDMI